MPSRRSNYARKTSRAHYRKSSVGRTRINWVAVGGTAAVLVAIVTGVVLLVRGCGDEPAIATPTSLTASPSKTPASVMTDTDALSKDGSSEERAQDYSLEALLVQSVDKRINLPAIYGDEMLYSAGTGTLDKPLMTQLYLMDLKTMEEKQITKVTVKNGEIYETCINTDYIVWLDTDQEGTNILYYIKRHDTSVIDGEMANIDDTLGDVTQVPSPSQGASSSPDASPASSASASPTAPASATPTGSSGNGELPQATQLKESNYYMPSLRLSGDRLIWNERDSDGFEVLYVVDLISEEPVALPGYTESLEGFEVTYAVSAPDIHGNQVIWAGPDSDDPTGKMSSIYACDLEQIMLDDDYQPVEWKADMFVHDPMTNGKAWAWIDRYHEPIQNLYLKYGDEVRLVSASTLDSPLSAYSLGDDMLVYAKGGQIWVYFYETGRYGRVTADGEVGRTPVTYGRRVVWFTDSEEGRDQLKVVYIP